MSFVLWTGSHVVALILGAVLAWGFKTKALRTAPPTPARTPLRAASRHVPEGLFYVTTTLGAVALSRFGIEEMTPEIGVFWLSGCLIGMTIAGHQIVDDVVSAHAHGLDRRQRAQLRGAARHALRWRGLDAATDAVVERSEAVRDKTLESRW